MKTKILSFFALILMSTFTAVGQVSIWSESFETDGQGSRYTANTSGTCNDFFQRVNSTPICFDNNITNTVGSSYMASEDVVDRLGGGGESANITFNTINISGYSSLTVSLRIGTANDNSATGAWEQTDHVFIEYAIDGNIGANNYTTAGLFNGHQIGSLSSGFLRVDTDNNPATIGPFGTTLSNTGDLITVPFNIPDVGSSLSIRIRNTQDGGSEELAYDFVEVKGVIAVNDAPVLANIEGSAINYTEGDAATQVTNSITISDTEGDNITSATVEVSAGFEVGEDVLTFTPLTGVSGSQTGNTLTLSGSKTPAEYQTLLRSVKYQNTNVINPSVATRTIRFRVSDGGNSNYQTRNINITPVVNPPTALPVTESFETDGEGTRYTSTTFSNGCDFFIRTNTKPTCHADAISDADGSFYWASEDARSSDTGGNPTRAAATVELSPLIATGHSQFTIDVLLGVSGNGDGDKFETSDAILIQYNFDGGGWTTVGAFYGDAVSGGHMRQDTNLNGSGDGTFLATELQNFQFGIIGTGTNLNVRVVVDQVGGSEEIVFDKITVAGFVPVNDPPVLANIEGTPINYVEGSGAQQITNTISITDNESDEITGATITVFQGFDASEDVLAFTPQFSVLGNYVGNTLTLSGTATLAEYQTLLRSVTYENTDLIDPSLQDRTIQFQVSDGTGSNFQMRTITIDAPLQAQSLPACESFETNGQGSRYSSYQFIDGGNYWRSFDNSGAKYPEQANAVTGATGNFIWIGEDVDEPTNPNPSGLGEMLLNPFNVATLGNFTISVDLATSSPLKWDTADFVKIQYKMDNGSWTTVGAFYGDDIIDGDMREDADLNGAADPAGAILTTTLTTFTYAFVSSGTTLQVRLLNQSDGNEELAFDNFCIVGVPSCIISDITLGGQGPCIGATYSQDVVVSYTSPPASGDLVVNGQSFAITTSPQTVTITGTPDNNPVDVVAMFSDAPGCTLTKTALFTAPAACPCNISALTAGDQSNCSNGLYDQDIIVTYTNAPSGSLDVHGQSFAISTSPQTVTLTGLAVDGNPLTVTASFSDDPGCTSDVTFTAPVACAETLFITKWVVNAGETITIPTFRYVYNYDYSVDWSYDASDGFIADESNVTGNVTSPVLTAGEHTVAITGTFPRIFFDNRGDKDKITEIVQWGTNPWTSMDRAFAGCSNLNIGLNAGSPDLSLVTNMTRMFNKATAFNSDIGDWDVSNVTNMSYLFALAKAFNQDLDNWDVSNVTNMREMFNQAHAFNGSVDWDVSNVEDMAGMFFHTGAFNQDISSWNTSSVTNMFRMLNDARAFDQNLGAWDIGNVTNMEIMLFDSELSSGNYDASLIGWATDSSGTPGDGIDDIPTSIIFDGGDSRYCNGATSRALLMNSLPTPTGYGWTITDGGTDCGLFITKWVVNAGETITIPTKGLGYNYNVDWSYNDIDGFNADESNVTGNATSPTLTAGEHIVAISGDFPRIFFNNTGDKDKITEIVQWGTNPWTTMDRAFAGCSNLDIINPAVGVPNLSLVTDMTRMFNRATSFNGDIGNWDVSTVTNMSYLFALCRTFNQDLNGWNTTNVTNMREMFNQANVFNGAIGNWNVSNVEDMAGMFFHTGDFNQDISGWDTSSVINMFRMLNDARAFDQNLGAWDIGNVTNMEIMLFDSELSTPNYDNTLIGWATDDSGTPGDGIDDIPTGIAFDGGDSRYCLGETARNLLTAALPTPVGYGWTISDGSLDCVVPLLGSNGGNRLNVDSVSLYPNPTEGSVTIVSPQMEVTSATVYDIRGRLVSEVDFRNKTIYQIDLSDMEASVYLIDIVTENGTITKRILKN